VALGDDHRRPEARLRLYLDSSGLIKLLIREHDSAVALEVWGNAERVACISLGYVEAWSAIARRLTAKAARRARGQLDELWDGVEIIDVDDGLVAAAVRVADAHRLRALDALHLAAAYEIRTSGLVFATWDRELARAATAAGFALAT
jgi:predicted nucleic acid-binding protein